MNEIKLGKRAHIGDKCVIHVSSGVPVGPQPTIVGDKTVVDSGTLLHACVVGTKCYIGSGCTILDAAVVGDGSWLAAGSLLGVGKKIPPGEVSNRVTRQKKQLKANSYGVECLPSS